MNNYDKIAEAIEFLQKNYKQQPELDEVAAAIHLSPTHFQKVFKEWAGVSPKKFLQFITIEHAKKILRGNESDLITASYETGLSGTSRLHDLFLSIEGMTPGEYKNFGKDLTINYYFYDTLFGEIIIASTYKGICYIAFAESHDKAFEELKKQFSNATFIQNSDELQQSALKVFSSDWNDLTKVKLHLKGTAFQIKVWEALLKIPSGSMVTYSELAKKVGNPRASRAVGSAVGDNPIAFLIPCHRVIRSTGEFGQYHWGSIRKTAMLGWEGCRNLEF